MAVSFVIVQTIDSEISVYSSLLQPTC